jgi:DNA processing protein
MSTLSTLLGFSFYSDITYFRLQHLLKKYPSAVVAWEQLSLKDLIELKIAPTRALEIIEHKNKLDLEKYADTLRAKNILVIDIFSAEYPSCLKEIYNPPLLLHCLGASSLQCDGLALVGTRHPTSYGIKATEQLVQELAVSGLTIVSGLAFGIDTVAHTTALQNNLSTIAVLGTGLDLPYPPENKKLFERIARKGLLVSEYPLNTKPMKWHFPHRNRIITGLSRAVCVMEGALTSGAMITGKLALDQNRDVYALPGQIFSAQAAGPNWLIAQGAKPIISLTDTVRELSGKQLSFAPQQLWPDLTGNEKIIYDLLGDIPGQLDTLIEKTQLPYTTLIQELVRMQLKGLVSELPGKRFVKT